MHPKTLQLKELVLHIKDALKHPRRRERSRPGLKMVNKRFTSANVWLSVAWMQITQ